MLIFLCHFTIFSTPENTAAVLHMSLLFSPWQQIPIDNVRSYLHHSVYLFLIRTTKKRMAQQLFFPYISCKTMTCVTWIMILRPLVQHRLSIRTNIHLRLLWRANKSFIDYFGTIQLNSSLYCYYHTNFLF